MTKLKITLIDNAIIDDEKFLSMSANAQSLYFKLNMIADMDGIIDNPYRDTLIGMNENSAQELIDNSYIIYIKDKAYAITHWWVYHKAWKEKYSSNKYKKYLDTDENKLYSLVENNDNSELLDSDEDLPF